MADTGTAPAARDPDTLVTEIQRTRDNLARTIDAIAERVSPASNARRALQRARDQASRVDVHYVAAGITIVAGFTAALMIWRYRR